MAENATFKQNQALSYATGLKAWEATPNLTKDEASNWISRLKDENDTDAIAEITSLLQKRGSMMWPRVKSPSGTIKGKERKPKKDWQKVYDEAHAAGMKAGNEHKPTPMVVGSPTTPLGNDIDTTKKMYHVSSGVCGFAWISFKGNTSWGRWAVKNVNAKNDHPTGKMIWVHEFGQSMEKKLAYARAFARHLRENGVKDAWHRSRMD